MTLTPGLTNAASNNSAISSEKKGAKNSTQAVVSTRNSTPLRGATIGNVVKNRPIDTSNAQASGSSVRSTEEREQLDKARAEHDAQTEKARQAEAKEAAENFQKLQQSVRNAHSKTDTGRRGGKSNSKSPATQSEQAYFNQLTGVSTSVEGRRTGREAARRAQQTQIKHSTKRR